MIALTDTIVKPAVVVTNIVPEAIIKAVDCVISVQSIAIILPIQMRVTFCTIFDERGFF